MILYKLMTEESRNICDSESEILDCPKELKKIATHQLMNVPMVIIIVNNCICKIDIALSVSHYMLVGWQQAMQILGEISWKKIL